VRFILNGEQFELTADDVRRRLYDAEPEPVHQLGVIVDGSPYPVKQAFELATGINRRDFTSHTARRHLTSLGFEVTQDTGSRRQQQASATSSSRPTAKPAAGDLSRIRPELAFAGRYQIIRLLGEGDRKSTYLALDTVLERQVALALIKPEAAQLDRLGTKRESDTLVQVDSHDNIVTLFDRGAFEGIEYLVFEYLPGGTLREYLAKQDGKRLPADSVMLLGRQLARALSHIHKRGLIHRDVAPANIWLDERHEAHLGDFDSAVRLDVQHHADTLPPTTEAYAPPELAAGLPLDERADLYSLGAVLYEAATGKRPERRASGLLAPRALQPDIPVTLNAVIYKLLSESPENRPANADIVAEMLKPTRIRISANDYLSWAETLPFPLASILRLYHAEIDPQSKGDHLLNFFEALAQFITTIELSAYRSDRELFNANRNSWFRTDPNNPNPVNFRQASFGLWVNLHRRLSNTTHRMLSAGTQSSSRCYNLFAATDHDLVDAVTSRDLSKALAAANQIRNAWSHRGVASIQEYAQRLRELEDLLASTQARLATAFEAWDLLKPGAGMFSDGMFDYTITVLTGTNPAFRKEQTQTHQPLDLTKLYLMNRGRKTALELVPLLRMMAGHKTEEEACYFYSRLQSEGVRWISYHFHAEPEIVLADERTARFIAELGAR
jgi:serine/threonine protein kinase